MPIGPSSPIFPDTVVGPPPLEDSCLSVSCLEAHAVHGRRVAGSTALGRGRRQAWRRATGRAVVGSSMMRGYFSWGAETSRAVRSTNRPVVQTLLASAVMVMSACFRWTGCTRYCALKRASNLCTCGDTPVATLRMSRFRDACSWIRLGVGPQVPDKSSASWPF